METKITQKTPVVIQAEISLPWEKVERSYKKAIREISGMVSIPGFRKGHAPAALVKKKYQEDITNSVARENVPDLIIEVIKQQDIKAVGEPQITNFALKEKEEFSFEFVQEVKPEFELKDWKGLEVESLNTKISDEMVDSRIEGILKAHAKKEEIKDRPAKEGETVKFQLTVMDNGSKDIIFDENFIKPLDESFPYPSLKTLIMSDKAGEDVELDMVPGEDFEIEDARGKNVKVFIELQSITNETIPVLDEEFAKHEGADSVEEFKNKTRENLQKQAEDMEKNRVDAVLMDKILEGYTFELPSTLVLDTLKYMATNELGPYINYIQDPKQRQKFVDNYFQSRASGAERLVRFDLILEKIAQLEKLEVTSEELKTKMEEIYAYLPKESQEKIDPADLESDFAGRVRLDILTQNAKDLIYGSAQISWVDELTPEPEPEPAESQTGESQTGESQTEMSEEVETQSEPVASEELSQPEKES